MKKVFGIFCILILTFGIVGYLLLFTSPLPAIFKNVPIIKGAVKITLAEEIVPVTRSKGGAGITYCSFAKKGCQDYVGIIPGSAEFKNLSEEQKDCVTNGCLFWGPLRKQPYTLELTDIQATSLANDYKPTFIPFKNIKMKFQKNKVYFEAISYLPFAPGILTIEAEQSGPKKIKFNRAYLGRIPLASTLLSQVEKKINTWLNYQWYESKLDSFSFEDGKVILQAQIPKEIIKEIKTY